MSSCWMPAANSQFHGRAFQPLSVAGSCCVSGIALPKVGVSHGPHSPLAVETSKLQSATLLRLASVTLMAVLVTNEEPGLSAAAVAIVSPATPRAADAFTAVLPLPKRSNETPTRGLMSF